MGHGDYRSLHDDLLKNSWTNRAERYWPQIINLCASFSAILLLFYAVFNINDPSDIELLYISLLSAFSIFLFFYVLYQEYRFSRKARYAEAMYSIHSGIHFLRDYQGDFENICDKGKIECKRRLSKVVTAFANAFSLVTGTHCRACIKTLELRDITQDKFKQLSTKDRATYLNVTTFCRDSSSARGENVDDKYTHPINGNTDFLELYLNFEKRMYFSNNIPHEKGYSNSSFQINKKLPYSSTVVWPIRKLVYVQDKKADELLNQEQDIIGYLCVDSARRNVFQEGYDFEMGAIIADALFVFLKGYHTYLNKVG